jgi:amino acid transporter
MVTALLLAGMASLLKAWNGMTIMAVRLLLAMSRHGFAPRAFAKLSGADRVPAAALCGVSLCSLAGLMFGRAAIDPIIAMASITLGFIYGATCLVALRLRYRGGARAWAMPAAGLAASAIIALVAIPDPFRHSRGMPAEYGVLAVWLGVGLVYWRILRRRSGLLSAT